METRKSKYKYKCNLVDYFNNYYTTSNNKAGSLVESLSPTLKLFNSEDSIELGEFFVGLNKIKSEEDFKKMVYGYQKKNREKYKQYKKFGEKLKFEKNGKISMSVKDLQITPPLVLWLEKLIKEGSQNNSDNGILFGNTLTDKEKEKHKIAKDFEKIMFNILGIEGESEFIFKEKNKNGRFKKGNKKTPDYVEEVEDGKIDIYDFKTGDIKTDYRLFKNSEKYKIKYKQKEVTVSNVTLILLDEEKGKNSNNCIYFRDFIFQKNIELTEEQKIKIDNIESDYLFYKNSIALGEDIPKVIMKILQ